VSRSCPVAALRSAQYLRSSEATGCATNMAQLTWSLVFRTLLRPIRPVFTATCARGTRVAYNQSMRLKIDSERWTAMFLTALGLVPSSCGTKPSASSAYPCNNPQPVVSGDSGYVLCDNGSMHRPVKASCPSFVPRSGRVAPPDAGAFSCRSDGDCPGPNQYCGVTGDSSCGLPVVYECVTGCVNDSDCQSEEILGLHGICVCAEPMGVCMSAACTSDSDCAPNLMCSGPSHPAGRLPLMFVCQTPSDRCGGDADCPSGQVCFACGPAPEDIGCAYAPPGGAGHRNCVEPVCPPVIGRPFLIGDDDRRADVARRGDWKSNDVAPAVLRLSSSERKVLGAEWTKVGLAEHASVAAFARFTLHLMSIGAPARLIERSNSAMADETLHAKLAFALASAYAGCDVGPGPLAIDGAFSRSSFDDILVAAIREGCIGETVAAIEATAAAEHAADPDVRRVLERIAADEARHAELAWQFVRWAVERSADDARRLAEREFALAREQAARPAPLTTLADRWLLAGGIVPDQLRRVLRAEALESVILVCARALLDHPTRHAAA
jgi:hypothetical protein